MALPTLCCTQRDLVGLCACQSLGLTSFQLCALSGERWTTSVQLEVETLEKVSRYILELEKWSLSASSPSVCYFQDRRCRVVRRECLHEEIKSWGLVSSLSSSVPRELRDCLG